ncbi:hypothetical protein [Winogradskyella alexanderae]|uniref:Lipocalin-like domain-containing protein n=1 Tax=Winogradskyella alexanderae TaxID=2877123 RepID=A0ABS7XQ55_9FLAO|nr:hypothetical protein [Winogradskyella alexanderae]MCA0131639.1 hypothetical protein [Winogradskyella alexanderae]
MIKKIFALLSFLILFIAVTCDNEPYEGDIIIDTNDECLIVAELAEQALIDFTNADDEDFNLFCQVYRDALQEQIEVCGDENGDLQATIDSLGECIPENNTTACELAIAATALALEDLEDAITPNYQVACISYREALQNQIEVCGDDGTLQGLINDLGNCEPVVFNVVGEWKLLGWQSDIPRDIDNDGIETNDYLMEIDCFENETASFNADGTGALYYRESMQVQVSSPTNNPNDLDYSVECFEDVRTFDFTWTQEGDAITVTLDSDGSVLDFFRNGDLIFIAMRDFFVATSISSNVEDIVQDIIWGYVRY